MNLKSKIILLAVIPLLAATAIITYVALTQTHVLTSRELAFYESRMIDTRREALRHNVSIAMSAIKPILEDSALSDHDAQEKIKTLLTGLTYGEDGYFFVYDQAGVNIVHPTQPSFVGQNLLEFQDSEGNYLIKSMLHAANNGGGFHRYIWEKPPLMNREDKLSYVVLIDRWQWMLGTGLYLDDIYDDLNSAQASINHNITNSVYSILLIVGGTVLLVISLGVFINIREHHLADARLKTLIQSFIRLQINERRRFSRELHDGINQMLVSSKFRIELVASKIKKGHEQSSVFEEIETAEKMIEQTINEVREISHNLRPSVIDDLGLIPAMQQLLDNFSERTNISVNSDYPSNLDQLPEVIEITLYRFVQECLSNIEKHAGASKVIIRAWLQSDRLKFECKDNGKGFDAEQASDGIGLINMRERLELVEGDFNLTSRIGGGTIIKASLPIGTERETNDA
ncbi:cache domain-containing protein [Marinomonas mediterranea]|uniref:cache domain-containing protein n=1 Tax=Marinomonas mediterranea TaxID=119864 RepID=UPI00234A74B9|nr:cache domain-containing protein [Marinomonas mediterranea]WCN07923.1 histidine kinase [Marinomonas mediterranea]WCN12018.1 histidine kinase [Marinomonas mediterranea]